MDIPVINQRDYGDSFCLATCYLAIAQYFGYDISMQDLIDEKVISASGSVKRWGDHFTRSEKKTYNVTNVKKEIDKGNPVILADGSPHFAVGYDYTNSKIQVMDPWEGETGDLGTTTLKKTPSYYYVCTE